MNAFLAFSLGSTEIHLLIFTYHFFKFKNIIQLRKQVYFYRQSLYKQKTAESYS